MPPTEQKPIFVFLKFGRKQDLQEFRNDGLLYMRPLAEFAKQEESETGRGDRFEGTTRIIQPRHVGKLIFETGIASLGKITAQPSDLAGPVRIALNRTASCDVFCMVAVRKAIEGPLVTSEVSGLGDSFVMVTRVREFIGRVVRAAQDKNNGIGHVECRLVEYYNADEDSGEVGRFRKRSQFADQHEFRIVVEPGSDVPRRFFVGSLLDITSEVLPSAAALQLWSFTLADTAG